MGAILMTLMSRSTSHRQRAVLAVLATTLALASCGESKSRYLANKEEKVYLKVPRDWKVLRYSASDVDPLEDATSQITLVWRSAATADEGGSPGDVSSDEPIAFTAVYELSGELNQRMSASLARVAASPDGFDPVLPTDDTQGKLVDVLDYEPLGLPGINGSRIVYRSKETAADDWSMVHDISAAYDSKHFRLYVLQVGCSVDCYDRNKDAISKVASSWLVKP